MKAAFPARPSPTLDRVKKARLQYPPKGIATNWHKFIIDDQGRVCRCTARGRLIDIGGRRTESGEEDSAAEA